MHTLRRFLRWVQQISPWWFLAGALVIFLAVGGYYYVRHERALASIVELDNYQVFPELTSTDRVTIVSPHLDDETLGLGGFVSRVRAQGIPVSVIFMTNGDDFSFGADLEYRTGYTTPDELIKYGEKRQEEALKATAALGIDSKDVYFLGMPDRGLKELLNMKDPDQLYTARGTLQHSSPYTRSFIQYLPYNQDALEQGLVRAINLTTPTYIFTTLPEDRHTDHAATAAFVEKVWPKLETNPSLYFFLIHYGGYPAPKGYDTNYPLLPPKALKDKDWQIVRLSGEELEKKQDALQEYKSQLKVPFLGKLMRSFLRQDELILAK